MVSFTKLHCRFNNIVRNCTELHNIVELLIAQKLFGNVLHYTRYYLSQYCPALHYGVEMGQVAQVFLCD